MADKNESLKDYMHVVNPGKDDVEVIIVSAKDEATAKDYVDNVRPHLKRK